MSSVIEEDPAEFDDAICMIVHYSRRLTTIVDGAQIDCPETSLDKCPHPLGCHLSTPQRILLPHVLHDPRYAGVEIL